MGLVPTFNFYGEEGIGFVPTSVLAKQFLAVFHCGVINLIVNEESVQIRLVIFRNL